MMNDKLDAERLYYVKKKNGDVCTRQSHLFSTLKTEKAVPFIDFDDDDIEKVLAPVPSYEELQALKEENTRLKERDKIYSELAENLLCIEEEKWYNLVENGTKEQRINFLKEKEKHSLLSAINKIFKLKGLLKECQPYIKSEKENWIQQGYWDAGKQILKISNLLTEINEVLKCQYSNQ